MISWLSTFWVLLLPFIQSDDSGDSRITTVDIYHSDFSEVVFGDTQDTVFAIGNVVFGVDKSIIYCDSAEYVKGSYAMLRGNVILDDDESRLAADSVFYDVPGDYMVARGSYVELWSRPDSLFGVGTHAYYNRASEIFIMEERPTVYLRFPDTANLVEVVADWVTYEKTTKRASADGNVVINDNSMSSLAGKAVMHSEEERLELYEAPSIKRGESNISGKEIVVTTIENVLSSIEVTDSARAEMNEPTDSSKVFFDKSILTGEHMTLNFSDGQLVNLVCRGQAYSWYYPSSRGRPEHDENSASGDSIRFTIVNEELEQVEVMGGAIGTYITGKEETRDAGDTVESVVTDSIAAEITEEDKIEDTVTSVTADTIDYSGEYIRYNIFDSLITLRRAAHVISGTVSLDAEMIDFDTKERMVEAYSAAILPDTTSNPYELSAQHEPNEIPVRLRDGEDEMQGDHLEYSIDTEKGRIVQSKSAYEQGLYYGEKAYRATKKIFYVKDGLYTPCDINYLHFWAKRMKMIEGEKLIARPVVMYIGRIPMMILPYYVFPLKKGRHSGFLPFTLGNLETGDDQYVRNVGYYWAASEYWDWRGALDYYDENSRININNRINYNKRYVFNGYVDVNWATQKTYDATIHREKDFPSWTLRAAHHHTVSPTFNIDASANYQSTTTYYQDYSVNLAERLNRTVRSQLTFSKKLSNSFSLSGSFTHDLNLDAKTRKDVLPSLSLRVPVIHPFGTGGRNEEGEFEEKWYHKFTVTFGSPRLTNYQYRMVLDSIVNQQYDTTFTLDSLVTDTGTIYWEDTSFTLAREDTLEFRSRQKYSRIDNSVSIRFSTDIADYFRFSPSFDYSENWYKIFETDQSLEAGIDASTTYRTYIYSLRASLSTDLYGTIYPNTFGLLGLRQTISPSVSYSYTPEINRHPAVRSYAGGSAGSLSESSLMGVSLKHLYQAKVAQDGGERNLDLVSITHSFSYNFRNKERPYSNLSTRFTSNVLPRVTLSGNMTHSFYEMGSNELRFWSPLLMSFSMNANLPLAGNVFLFDDPYAVSGEDTESEGIRGSPEPPGPPSGSSGWSLSVGYSHQESGRGENYTKQSSLRFNLSFKLTPETAVSYEQYYDIDDGKTVTNRVSITRKLKCWTAVFSWYPTGSVAGYSFRLFVTEIPAIKIDRTNNPLGSGYFESYLR